MFSSGPFFRDDTIFGVCEALGEDFGFNPNILRALIGAGLLFDPMMAAATYGVGAVLVTVSRLLVPDLPKEAETAQPQADVAGNRQDEEELPLAA